MQTHCRVSAPRHAKRLARWRLWLDESLLAPVPHRQVVLTLPKRLRVYTASFRNIGLTDAEQVIRFDGAPGGDSIPGTLRIAYATFPLTLHRYHEAALPYRREDVTFANGEVTLAGTLYLPPGRGPFPVVLFTHGSGDQTRDGHAVEADQLVRAGIVTALQAFNPVRGSAQEKRLDGRRLPVRASTKACRTESTVGK